MKNAAFPVILIVLGAAWLVQELGWIPDWHIVGAIGLVLAGIVVLVAEGPTKASVVSGPMLIFAGAAWFARDHRLIGWNVIGPLALIVLGICLFVSRLPAVPHARGRAAKREREIGP